MNKNKLFREKNKQDFIYGVRRGLPIALGYIPVSFTFGIMAVNGGLSPLMATFISLSNLTSAGQFAGTRLIIEQGTYLEIAITTFVINIRYMLMSLSISQRLKPGIGTFKRLVFSFGITDETFAIASLEQDKISEYYMYGLISTPIIGWSMGTALGAFLSTLLPAYIVSIMGIGLYAMFIALIVNPSRENKNVLFTVIIAILLSCFIKYFPIFATISSGFRVIIAAVLASAIAAFLYPINKEVA